MAMEFTPTQFLTTQDKQKLSDEIVAFIEKGCPKHLFTRRLYGHLSNMFNFIAHYNKETFWNTWLDTSESRKAFVDQIKNHTPVGDPAFTKSDVERDVQQRLAEVAV